MDDLFWSTEARMARLKPFFPLSHEVPRVDDRRVLSGIIFINRNGLRWRDAPPAYGPPKTHYDRWVRWSRLGVFARIHTELAAEGRGCRDDHDRRDPFESPPHGVQPAGQKGECKRFVGRNKGGLNSKLHAVADAKGRPIDMYLSAGQTSDYIGARALLPSLPKAGTLLADRGYDVEWFRNTLTEQEIQPCIRSRKDCKNTIAHDADFFLSAYACRAGCVAGKDRDLRDQRAWEDCEGGAGGHRARDVVARDHCSGQRNRRRRAQGWAVVAVVASRVVLGWTACRSHGKLARRRAPKRAMVALAWRFAVILHRMWKDDTNFPIDIPVLHAG